MRAVDRMTDDGRVMRDQEGPSLKIRIDTILVLLISLTPFNLSVVDKTGLDGNLDNSLDKIVRVLWFIVAMSAVILLKPSSLVGVFTARARILKLFLLYCFVILLGLVLNGIGIVGYYRLLEYLPFLCGLVLLDKLTVKNGTEAGVKFFARWVSLTAWLTLLTVFIGGVFSLEHFYALETQGRYRLGGNAYSPNYLGMVFVGGMLSGIYLFAQSRLHVQRWVLALGIFLFFIALYLTGSRTAQFSLIIALGWWWYVKRTQISRLALVMAIVFVVVPILAVFLQILLERLLPMIGKGERPLYDLLTLNNRSVVAEVGLKGALEHWGLGVGFVEGVKDYYKNNFTQSYWLPPHSHNALIEVFLSGGFFALLLMLVPFFSVVNGGVRHTVRPGADHYIFLVVLSIPLLLGCVTMTIFGGVYTALTFWFFSIALLIGRSK